MATDAENEADSEPFVPPATRFESAHENLVRYDFDQPYPPDQRLVGIETDHAHVAIRVDEGADAAELEGLLTDLATELGFAATAELEVTVDR